jgi:hypothetical protein
LKPVDVIPMTLAQLSSLSVIVLSLQHHVLARSSELLDEAIPFDPHSIVCYFVVSVNSVKTAELPIAAINVILSLVELFAEGFVLIPNLTKALETAATSEVWSSGSVGSIVDLFLSLLANVIGLLPRRIAFRIRCITEPCSFGQSLVDFRTDVVEPFA